jgi:hypothetical protein
VVIVFDLIHVLHYLWRATMAIHGGTSAVAERWVRISVDKLLTRPVVDVVAGLRQSATLREITDACSEAAEACAEYLRAESAVGLRGRAAGRPADREWCHRGRVRIAGPGPEWNYQRWTSTATPS